MRTANSPLLSSPLLHMQAGWWGWPSLLCFRRSAAAPQPCGRSLPWRRACCASGATEHGGLHSGAIGPGRGGVVPWLAKAASSDANTRCVRACCATYANERHVVQRSTTTPLAGPAGAPSHQAAPRATRLPGSSAVLHPVQLHAGVRAALCVPSWDRCRAGECCACREELCKRCSCSLHVGAGTTATATPTPPPCSYHVHEKAILMVTLPLGVLLAAGLAPGERPLADFLFINTGGWVGRWWDWGGGGGGVVGPMQAGMRTAVLMRAAPLPTPPPPHFTPIRLPSTLLRPPRAVGTYSLFPLLFEPQEYPIKACAAQGLGREGRHGSAATGPESIGDSSNQSQPGSAAPECHPAAAGPAAPAAPAVGVCMRTPTPFCPHLPRLRRSCCW